MKKKTFRLSDTVPDARRDVDDELAFHLEMRTKEFMEQGMSEDDARRKAAESFGDVKQIRGDLESEREERNQERARGEWWLGLRGDVSFALRSLVRNKAFALAAVATLALGIGANSAIFSVVNSVLLRPLPFPDADRLVVLWGKYPNYGRTGLSLPDFNDWRAQATRFEQVAARASVAFNYTGGDEPVQLRADRVTANFFTTLGVQPMIGRGFRPDEEVGGDDRVVVLSHGLWQRQFGSNPDIVNNTIQLSGLTYTVVGVMPPKFRFWRDVDLWTTEPVDRANANRRAEYLTAFARMRPGVTVSEAGAEIATIAGRLSEQYPNTNQNFQSEVVSLHDETVASVRPALLVFTGAVALVLLIACANVANLLLARAAAREREVAVRSALGASRSRLMRQLLTESGVVALIGGVVGLVLATWGIGALRATGTNLLPRLTEIRVDLVVVVFSLGLSLVTGLLFGLAPSLRLASNKLHDSIKEGSRGAAGGAVTRFRNALVLAEVAIAVVLLVGAGLLIRSFEKLNRVDPGFEPSGILTYRAQFPVSRYPEATLSAMYDQIIERTRAVPGVRAVAMSNTLPMQGSGYVSFNIEGVTFPAGSANSTPIDVQPFTVTPDFLKVMGLKLLSGRFIEPTDVNGAPGVLVINSVMQQLYFKDREPIGQRISFSGTDSSAVWFRVVGVVDVIAQEGLDSKPYAQVYLPLAQSQRRGVFVSIKTDGDPLSVVPGARQALRSADPEVPMHDVATMATRVADSIAAPRVSVAVLTLFAGLALVLAAIGIYGVLSYAVAQRTREIGIRMALGANARDVRLLIVRQGMSPAVGGLALGLVGAYFATRLMQKLLFGVEPTDPVTFAVVGVFLATIAFLASYLPARRATRVAPTEALRYE